LPLDFTTEKLRDYFKEMTKIQGTFHDTWLPTAGKEKMGRAQFSSPEVAEKAYNAWKQKKSLT
jgi:hypothetical protein